MKKLLQLCILATSVLASKKKKQKVGVDMTITDIYHPWDGKEEDPIKAPTSAQHSMAEFLLQNIKSGDSLDKSIAQFEDFSARNHVGMTLGEEKGKIIESSIRENLARTNPSSVVFLEFGSHIGDGTLRVIRELAKSQEINKCTILSFEANQEWLGIGTSLVRHALNAASERKCQYIPMMLTDDLSHIVEHIAGNFGKHSVTGIIFDHNHAKFNRDIHIFRERKLLRKGALVLADNALRHKGRMKSFLQFMKDHSSKFELVPVNDPYPDQILVSEWNDISSQRVTDELYRDCMCTYGKKIPTG